MKEFDSDISKKFFKNALENYNINLYEKVLELRKFEIENFWRRAIFFWGIISLLYLGFFNLDTTSYYFIVLPLVGVLFNIIFSLSIRGSKYWQEHYEHLANQFEVGMDFILFRHLYVDTFPYSLEKKFLLSKSHRFSVSKLAMLLSDLSTIIWVFLWIWALYVVVPELRFEFSRDSLFHFPTLSVIVIHLVLVLYFIIFIKNGKVYHPPNTKPSFLYDRYRDIKYD